MGAKGGASPQPWKMYRTSTTFLRVPSMDWAAVKQGVKTEFRCVGPRSITNHEQIQTPTPVVAYTIKPGENYDSKLMVLMAAWQEPLGAISRESLRREGFEDLAHFRRYWAQRTHRRFRPLTSVTVYLVKPFDAELDPKYLGGLMLQRLYRDHL